MNKQPDPMDAFIRDDIQTVVGQNGRYELYFLSGEEGYCIVDNGDKSLFFVLSNKNGEISIIRQQEEKNLFDDQVKSIIDVKQDSVPFQLDGVYALLWVDGISTYRINLSVKQLRRAVEDIFHLFGNSLPWIFD